MNPRFLLLIALVVAMFASCQSMPPPKSGLEVTGVRVLPEGHVEIRWINHSGKADAVVVIADDAEFNNVVETMRFPYGLAGFPLPAGDHFFLKLGTLDRGTEQGTAPWAPVIEVQRLNGMFAVVNKGPGPKLTVNEIRHIPMLGDQVLEVDFALTLPAVGRKTSPGTQLVVRPFVDGAELTANSRTFDGFNLAHRFVMRFSSFGNPIPLSKLDEFTPLDLVITLDEDKNAHPDGNEYSVVLRDVHWK